MKYTAYLMRTMSQQVEFEAPKGTDPEKLAAMANDLSELDPNISNAFDADGEVEVHFLRDEQGRTLYSDTGEEVSPDAAHD
jgi:predicted regulator of Ras-like GTPase activity (Roadblock/LC7/MglB family)